MRAWGMEYLPLNLEFLGVFCQFLPSVRTICSGGFSSECSKKIHSQCSILDANADGEYNNKGVERIEMYLLKLAP